MFYPVESLKRGGRFYLCWVADSWPLRFATITQRQLWSQDVRQICDDLMEVMNRESGYVSTRFSLRLSSQLMRGLVRLYQRKVAVFLGDLCMINATVIKHTNKKWGPQESLPSLPHPRTPRRTAVVVEEVPEVEERVEERIQESGNVVANIEQITLREAAIPEIQVPADGFGEENPEQAFQLLNDRTLEQMLGQADGSAVQHSGLDLPILDNAEKSHDKSRLYPHDAMQMERISELDMTMFRKSTAVDDLMLMDLEKDIPPIPDIPIPDLSVLPPEKEVVPEEPPKEKTREPQDVPIPIQKEREPPVEFQLEELEENFAEPKRKRPKRLIVDKKTKTVGAVFRQRLDNINVELRCEDSSDDIIDALFVPAEMYLRRPASVGWRVHARLGYTLTGMFLRNLGVVEPPRNDEEIEQMLGTERRKTRATRDKIVEEEAFKTPPVPAISVQQTSVIPEETLADVTEQRISAALEPLDIADMPTQVLLLSQEAQKRAYEGQILDLGGGVTAKRTCRRSGYVSFKESQLIAEQLVVEEQQRLEKEKNLSITVTPKKLRRSERKSKDTTEFGREKRLETSEYLPKDIPENVIPQIIEPEIELQESQMNDQDREKHVSQLLEAAGLADATNVPVTESVARNGSQNKTQSKIGDESSETPLGSLDRTKVDLGESVKTTDTQRFLRTEWGTQGTMLKVVKHLNKGRHPLTVRVLLDKGPVPQSSLESIIAARCFTSLLKLKQHRFIKLEKDAITLEVTDILCGSKINM